MRIVRFFESLLELLVFLLEVLFVGMILSIIRQKYRIIYFSIIIPTAAFLLFIIIGFPLEIILDINSVLFFKKYWIFFIIPYFLFLFLFDNIFKKIQFLMYNSNARLFSKWWEIFFGFVVAILFILGLSYEVIPVYFIHIYLGIIFLYVSLKMIYGDENENSSVIDSKTDEELFNNAMQNEEIKSKFISSGISKEEFIQTLRKMEQMKDDKPFMRALSSQRYRR